VAFEVDELRVPSMNRNSYQTMQRKLRPTSGVVIPTPFVDAAGRAAPEGGGS